ncbi:Zn-dependent peptidase ImmA, M78 family [Chitinophaga sp. CF118]|uniref:XRE family transcriptional regulator n=1 Tax=Chitinophaga sp. CF118 TaxID=1884367 RepID=UPI0008E768BE|nr:XRE family transcriptional regulator [Chitinophaga sp. CF118]SFE44026.1 Zn-dependent peptidase ImmA, M78 family [Chitinophaga sp. CF118]
MADKAYITPKVLRWARESARISLETAAAKVNVTAEKLSEWEEGVELPTIRQAETLAKSYKRPFALFFLPEVPRDFQPLQDFRKDSAKELGTASVFIIREIQQKQTWTREVYEDEGNLPLPFVGKYNLDTSPQQVAADILSTLQIDPLNYKSANPIKEWIEKAEAKGIFISRTSFIHSKLKLDSKELQGFAIADKYAPFVFVNSENWDAPQLFTLVHELAHIWIAASGISNEIEPELDHKDNSHPVEIFCNEVAANALMPSSIMLGLPPSTYNAGNEVFNSAKKLGISSFALLVRAFNMQLISLDKYRKLKKEAEISFRNFLIKEAEINARRKEKKDKGGPNYYMLLVNKNGHLFTKVVMDAFRGGFIQPTQASSLLNTQINNFSKLESFLYK